MQTKLSFYLNEIFKYLVLFLLFFVWINFYYPNFLASVFIAVLLAGFASYAFSFLFYKKQEKSKTTSQDKKKMKDSTTQLIFNEMNENLSFFSEVFRARNITVKTVNYGLLLYPNTPDCILFLPVFTTEELMENIVINAYKQLTVLNAKKCIISGIKFSNTASQLANSLSDVAIVLYNENLTYTNLLKPVNKFPENKVEFKNSGKLTAQMFFTLLVNKKIPNTTFTQGFLCFLLACFYA